MTIEEFLANGAKVVDVRTPEEFAGGHVQGSINIPLHLVPTQMDQLRDLGPMVLCCASGGRSGQAEMFLRQNGIDDCINGGPWIIVDSAVRQMQ